MTDHDIAAIKTDLRTHIADSSQIHAQLSDSDAIMTRQVNLIADEILGESRIGFDGEVIRDGGMKRQLADLYHAEMNGGLNTKPVSVQVETRLKPSDRTAIIVALIASVGSIVVAILSSAA